jgi:haloacetate dehalogenase
MTLASAEASVLDFFQDFELKHVQLPEASLRVRTGGSGSPVLLLHGHPRTHTTWHRVAPILAERHFVVCPDLRGFGQSEKPARQPDFSHASKRSKARDCVDLMQHFGFSRFAIVGHDRGACTAFRAAMDHPQAISSLIILDSIPILESLERCDARFAEAWWHWFFFAQEGKPERAIITDPDAWYGGSPSAMGQKNFEDYHLAIHDPTTVVGMLDDYRAALGIDRRDDGEDRQRQRKIDCPTLILWSLRDDLADLHGDILEIWRQWASRCEGYGIDSGHHVAEECSEELSAALLRFLGRADPIGIQ